MMLGFIDAHRQEYGVEPICDVLPIAPSTVRLHAACKADPAQLPARARLDAGLKADIQRVFDENFQVYGVRKVWRQLQREGVQVARCTVARLMREMGLRGAIRGKPVKTTIADKALPCPLDRVNRQFRVDRPDQLWLSDFTYVSTWNGFVYVAFIIDAFARRIIGWRVSRTADAGFVLDALEQALHQRRPVGKSGLVHHSDRGSQDLSIRYTDRSAVLATATTMPWPKPSTASTRLRSSTGEDLGNPSKPLNTQPSNGSTGSTKAPCSNPSEISRLPKPNNAIMTP